MQPGRVMTSEELAEALAERERVEAKIEKFRLAALELARSFAAEAAPTVAAAPLEGAVCR